MMGIKKLYWALRHYIFWKYIAERQWKNIGRQNQRTTVTERAPFSIGIVTYIARYEKFFKPLISKLARLLPDVEIVIMINGYYDEAAQEKYLLEATKFLDTFPNVKYVEHTSPEGLSTLWNKLIINSSSDKVFIMNDDIIISPGFREQLFQMKKDDITLINNSWSHFLILKKTINEFGWFDERFTGVGNEDQDYDFRLTAKDRQPENILFNTIKNFVEITTDFSYGKDMKTINKKYTAGNREFLENKWEISENEKPGYKYSTKFGTWFHPVPKIESPDFHPEIQL